MTERSDDISPKVLAHRGFSLDGAENTLPAFKAARELGCTWIETDVHTTRDGVVVAFHDPTLERVTQGAGQINDVTYEELAHLAVAGSSRIPTLREVLEELPDVYVNIDVKDEASVRTLPRLLAETGAAGRVRIASFSESRRVQALAAMRELGLEPMSSSAGALGTTVAVLVFRLLPAAWPVTWRLLRNRVPEFDTIQMPLYLKWTLPAVTRLPLVGGRLGQVVIPSRRAIRAAHRYGFEAHVWTVDHPEEMRMLLDREVDALITDRADIALAVVAGTWPEAPGL